MLTNQRIREIRHAAGLRQEDMAVLLGVGIATLTRWEKIGNSLPTGLPWRMLDVLDQLARSGIDLREVSVQFRESGSLSTVRWLLNQHAQLKRAEV